MVSQSSLMMELANLPSTIARALSEHLWGTLQDQQGLRLRNEAFRLGIRGRNRQLRDLQSEKQEGERRQQFLQAEVQRLKTELGIRDTRLRHERRVIQSLKIAVGRCEDELAEKRDMIDEYRRDIEFLVSENIRLKAGQEKLGQASHQLEDRLRHEINLRRACVKAELEAKKERDNVVGLWYCQQIRISELEDAMNTSSKCFQMNQSSHQEAEIRRLDAFADLVSEIQIIWYSINKDSSSAKREYLHELRNVLGESIKDWHHDYAPGSARFLMHRISRLEDLILKRQCLETNVLDNMQNEWDYLVTRERLYDELRNAQTSLARMDALDTQKLKEVMRDWRSLDDRAIENLDLQETFHFHQSKIPIHAALLEFISQMKRQIDELEHSRLHAWMDYLRGISLDENARKEIMILRNRRTTRLRVGYVLDGCSYCDDDACEGCAGTKANEPDDNLTMLSSVEHNELGQFKGATEGKGKGFVEAEWRISPEEEEITNHNQEGRLYCDYDSCKGCDRADTSGTGGSDTDPTISSSANCNEQGQFSNVGKDNGEADVDDEGRDSPAPASIDNQDQVNTGQIQRVLGGLQEINPDYKQEDRDSEQRDNRTHEGTYDSADENAEDYHESQREVPLGACKKNRAAKNGKKTKKNYPKRGRGRHY